MSRRINPVAVRDLAAGGTPDASIAVTLACHRETVRRHRAGAPSGRAVLRQARLERVRELHAQGLSDREIAKATRRKAASAVAKDRAALKLPANYRGLRRLGEPPCPTPTPST